MDLVRTDVCVSNKLHFVKPLLGYRNLSTLSRQDVVLARLRVGHSRINHSYHGNRKYPPRSVRTVTVVTVHLQ